MSGFPGAGPRNVPGTPVYVKRDPEICSPDPESKLLNPISATDASSLMDPLLENADATVEVCIRTVGQKILNCPCQKHS